MIAPLENRNRSLLLRLTALLLCVALLGTALALLLRKEQAQRRLAALHGRILTNLPLMAAETANLQREVTAFRQGLPGTLDRRSPDLLLYTRLDQIKALLQPSEMTITGVETGNGRKTISFNLKVPAARYSALVNGMGQLQTELFPFVEFREITLNPTATDSSIALSGRVLLPTVGGGA